MSFWPNHGEISKLIVCIATRASTIDLAFGATFFLAKANTRSNKRRKWASELVLRAGVDCCLCLIVRVLNIGFWVLFGYEFSGWVVKRVGFFPPGFGFSDLGTHYSLVCVWLANAFSMKSM